MHPLKPVARCCLSQVASSMRRDVQVEPRLVDDHGHRETGTPETVKCLLSRKQQLAKKAVATDSPTCSVVPTSSTSCPVFPLHFPVP